MAIYTDRRKAAEARMKFRRGVTPRDEVRAGMVQYRNDQAEERAVLDKMENLKPEKKLTVEKSKGKTVIKKKPQPVEKPKAKKTPVAKEPQKKGDFSKDFYEGGGD